ncbi:MAG: sulfate ABC transporter permease subunit CysW, partial [Rhizobacter sp.]
MSTTTTTIAALPAARAATAPRTALAATAEPAWVRRTLIGVALAFLAFFLFVPLATVFFEAF